VRKVLLGGWLWLACLTSPAQAATVELQLNSWYYLPEPLPAGSEIALFSTGQPVLPVFTGETSSVAFLHYEVRFESSASYTWYLNRWDEPALIDEFANTFILRHPQTAIRLIFLEEVDSFYVRASISASPNVTDFNLRVFAHIPEMTQTPIPAALPLFATVLAGGGVLMWRRRRSGPHKAHRT
jgi:hypothetical protein